MHGLEPFHKITRGIFLLGILSLPFLRPDSPFDSGQAAATGYPTQTVELAQKMESLRSWSRMGRSPRSGIRTVLGPFIKIAGEAGNVQELDERLSGFAQSKFAQDRGIRVGAGRSESRSGITAQVYSVSYGNERVEVIFFPLSSRKFSPKLRLIESRPEPPLPAVSLPPAPRSEARMNVYANPQRVTIDPLADKENLIPVSLASLGINEFYSAFEIRAMLAFLYRSFSQQPVLDKIGEKFPLKVTAITKTELESFFQMLYEIQESVRLRTGNKFDRDAVFGKAIEFYHEKVFKSDTRWVQEKVLGLTVDVPSANAIRKEREYWPQIFKVMLDNVFSHHSEINPFKPVGLQKYKGKEYVEVIPGSIMEIKFLPGRFPAQGISLVAGQRHETIVTLKKGVIRFRYQQDPSQDRTFKERNETGLLTGYVEIGSAAGPAAKRKNRIILPRAKDVERRHAVFALSEKDGAVILQITDSREGDVPISSGQMTRIEYPRLEDVELPHYRSEVRNPPSKTGDLRISKLDPDQLDRLPQNVRVSGLTRGLNPDLRGAEDYAWAVGGGLDALNSLGRVFPSASVSNDPGALIFASAKIPTELELTVWRFLLRTQKQQFLRIVLPEDSVSEKQWKELQALENEIFAPVGSIGKRFKIERVKKADDLGGVRQGIYNAMRETGLSQIGSSAELSEKYLVQWLDENLPLSFNAASAKDPLFAKILESNIGGEPKYSELMVWGAAHAMKISQGIEADKLKQETAALIQSGRRIEYRISDSLRLLVSRFFDAVQKAAQFARAA